MVMYGYGNYGYYNDMAMQIAFGLNAASYAINSIASVVSDTRRNSTNSSTSSPSMTGSSSSGYSTNPYSTKLGDLLTNINRSAISTYPSANSGRYQLSEYSPFTAQSGQMPPFAENSAMQFLTNERKVRSIPDMMNIFTALTANSGIYWRGNPAQNPAYGSDLLKMNTTFSSNGFEYSTMEQGFQKWLSSQNKVKKPAVTTSSRNTNSSSRTVNSNNNSQTITSSNSNMTNTSVTQNLTEKMKTRIHNLAIKAKSVTKYDKYINKYSNMYGVDPLLVKSIISQESNWNPTAGSSAGARGLMQLMPATAKQYGCTNRDNPEQNIKAGVQCLAKLLDKYDNNAQLALAAYNAGPGHVDDILNGTNKYKKNPQLIKDPSGMPRFKETQEYVPTVLGIYNELLG